MTHRCRRPCSSFQQDHGLNPDGVVGKGTMVEINRSVAERLQSVIVAMERERWMNKERGARHVLVNLTDFSARIVDNDRVSFQTRAVVGKNVHDRRSPEFSDVMEFLVINPTWNVPRSIAVKEYLPMMKRNPNAAGHLQLYNASGRKVSRANIDFSVFNERNFPFDIKQPPSRRNALGLVKFMFPTSTTSTCMTRPKRPCSRARSEISAMAASACTSRSNSPTRCCRSRNATPRRFSTPSWTPGARPLSRWTKPVPVHITYRTAFHPGQGAHAVPARRL